MRTKILILIPTILVAAGIVLFITFAAVQNGAWAKISRGKAETADSVSSIQNTENTRDAGSTQNTESTQSTENGRNTGNNGSVASGEMQNASRPAESAGSEEKEDAAEKTVYLTFDDGPSEMTPLILDILEDYQVRATFFVTGINPGCAGYIRDAYEAGHTIGMHTYSHDYAEIYSSVRAYYDESGEDISGLSGSDRLCSPLYPVPGRQLQYGFRKYSPGIMTYLTEDVTERGYLYCDWNCANGDGGGQPVGAGTRGKTPPKERSTVRLSCCVTTETANGPLWMRCLRSSNIFAPRGTYSGPLPKIRKCPVIR